MMGLKYALTIEATEDPNFFGFYSPTEPHPMPINAPRSHHYLPQFYLRGFTNSDRGRNKTKRLLWVYERGRTARLATPRSEACQRDFYAFNDASGQRQGVEHSFARMESSIAPLFRKIEDADYPLTASQKAGLAIFVALMCMRGPAGREFLGTTGANLILTEARVLAEDESRFRTTYEVIKGQPRASAEVENRRKFILSSELEAQVRSREYNLMWLFSFSEIMGVLFSSYEWNFVRTDEGTTFVTSDTPVFPLVPNNDGEATPEMDCLNAGVEWCFPKSAQVCLRLGQFGASGYIRGSDNEIRQVNRSAIVSARRFVYAPRHLEEIERLLSESGG